MSGVYEALGIRRTSMARKKKPCEFCNQETILRLAEECRNVDAVAEIYPDNGFMSVSVHGINDEGETTGEHEIEIPLNYCPNCGRKLGY